MTLKQYFRSYAEVPEVSDLSFVYCPKCSTKLARKEIDSIERSYCPECNYIQYLNPLPGVSVLIVKNQKLLIGKRGPNSFESRKWCLPGGFIEHYESFIEAAHREVLEETGLEIEIRSLVNLVSNQLTPNLHTLVPVMMASIVGGEPTPGDDVIQLSWLSKTDPLPPMAFEADAYIIRKYFENKLIEIPIDERFKTKPRVSPRKKE